MNFRFLGGLCIGLACLSSCVDVNEGLGQSYMAKNQQYDIYTAEFPIEDIRMEKPEELSAASSYRFIVGAIRDPLFGLTTRSTTFTLVPVMDTLDFGKPGTQKIKQFHFVAPIDTLSYASESQAHILQNINVYEVEEYVDVKKASQEIKHGNRRITKTVPIYDGGDSLSFDFTEDFARKYMEITQADLDTITTYSKKFPGIYLTTDAPSGEGGRINMFKLPMDVASSYIYGSYAVLKFSAEYENKGVVDTSFYFTLGNMDLYSFADVTSTSVSDYPQAAYNITGSESDGFEGPAAENYYLEGGKGLKPVVKAASIREKILAEVSKHGDPADIIISKATVTLPFKFPENYKDMAYYPTTMSPTCRIVAKDGTVTFGGLTDSSVSTEDQGDVNRSTCVYAPDITHHTQQIVTLTDESKIENYDIWFLPVAVETVTSAADKEESSSEYSSLLQQLAYASYYNNMYGGYGYGSSSYYGGSYYGNGYSNYYAYSLLSQMYSSSSSSEETLSLLDLGRFYKAEFYGPGADKNVPTFSITYAVPIKQD